MGNRSSNAAATILQDSPCSKCVVSNRSVILAMLIFIVFLGALNVILIWSMALNQTMQITTSIFSGVMFVLALTGSALPMKCAPCLCIA